MRLPHAPLYGAFARAWALSEQGITVVFKTAGVRHFQAVFNNYAQSTGPRVSGDIMGDDPDAILDQAEAFMVEKKVHFTRSTVYLEEVEAWADRANGIPNPGPATCKPNQPCQPIRIDNLESWQETNFKG